MIFKNSYQPILGFFSLNLIQFYENTINKSNNSIKLPPFQTFEIEKNQQRNKIEEEEEINSSRIHETMNVDNPSTPLLKNKQKKDFEMKVKFLNFNFHY